MLRDFLDQHLIESVVLGDYLSGAAGELPANIYPTVWILYDEDLERGRELLTHFLAQTAMTGGNDAWTCAICGESVDGELGLCWSCGSNRPKEA